MSTNPNYLVIIAALLFGALMGAFIFLGTSWPLLATLGLMGIVVGATTIFVAHKRNVPPTFDHLVADTTVSAWVTLSMIAIEIFWFVGALQTGPFPTEEPWAAIPVFWMGTVIWGSLAAMLIIPVSQNFGFTLLHSLLRRLKFSRRQAATIPFLITGVLSVALAVVAPDSYLGQVYCLMAFLALYGVTKRDHFFAMDSGGSVLEIPVALAVLDKYPSMAVLIIPGGAVILSTSDEDSEAYLRKMGFTGPFSRVPPESPME